MALRSEVEIRHALQQMLKCLEGADALEESDESDEMVTLSQMSTAGIVGVLEWVLGGTDPDGFHGVLEALDRIERAEIALDKLDATLPDVTEMPKHRHRRSK